jgi:hypothetical protein
MPSFSLLKRSARGSKARDEAKEQQPQEQQQQEQQEQRRPQQQQDAATKEGRDRERRLSRRDILQGLLNRTRHGGRAPQRGSDEGQKAEAGTGTVSSPSTTRLTAPTTGHVTTIVLVTGHSPVAAPRLCFPVTSGSGHFGFEDPLVLPTAACRCGWSATAIFAVAAESTQALSVMPCAAPPRDHSGPGVVLNLDVPEAPASHFHIRPSPLPTFPYPSSSIRALNIAKISC